jgi:hypothetical protein
MQYVETNMKKIFLLYDCTNISATNKSRNVWPRLL